MAGGFDGSIRINTKIDISDARASLVQLQKELKRVDSTIERNRKNLAKLSPKLAEYEAKRADLESGRALSLKLDRTDQERRATNAEYDYQLAKLKDEYAEVLKLQGDYNAALEEATRRQAELTGEIGEASEAYRDALAKAGRVEDVARASERLESSAQRVARKMLSWSTVMLGVRGVIGILRKSVNAFLSDNEGVANQLTAIWSALGNALGPIITRIIGLIQTLFATISAFIKAITGIDLVANYNAKALENQADATAAAGSAAEKAEKQLASFDEQNKLTDTSSSSGGGGGGGGIEIPSLLDEIDNWLTDFATKLGMTVKDVFFEWSDLTGEQILEKIVVGLSGLAGGMIGFVVGGPAGAALGAVIGIGVGLLASTVIFDHDAVVSGVEMLKSLIYVLSVAAGGLIGFFLGGPGGAAIGLTIGLGIAGFIAAVKIDWSGTENAIRSLRNEIRDCGDTIELAERSFANTEETINTTAATAEWYVGKLEELEAAGLDTADAHAKYNVIVEKLNDLLPNLNLVINEETGLIEGGTTAIRDQIAAWKNLAIQEALATRYKTELQAWADATVTLSEQEGKLAALQEEHVEIEGRLAAKYAELDLLTEQYNEELASSNGLFSENAGLVNEMETAQQGLMAEISQLNAELSNNEVAQSGLQAQMVKSQDAIDGYNDTVSAAEQAMIEFMNTTETTTAEVGESVDSMANDTTSSVGRMSANSISSVKRQRAQVVDETRKMRAEAGSAASGMESDFSSAWSGIQQDFANWGTFWQGPWTKLKNTFSTLGTSIGSAISGAVKNAINSVLSLIQSRINSAISIINGAIGIINKLPGVSVGYLSSVSLPRLAKGGVVNNPGMGVAAVIGEAGKEAVLPLERNTEWMDTLADKLAARIGSGTGQIVLQNYMNTRKVSEEIINYQTRRNFAMNNA